jgi:hypothetical protein
MRPWSGSLRSGRRGCVRRSRRTASRPSWSGGPTAGLICSRAIRSGRRSAGAAGSTASGTISSRRCCCPSGGHGWWRWAPASRSPAARLRHQRLQRHRGVLRQRYLARRHNDPAAGQGLPEPPRCRLGIRHKLDPDGHDTILCTSTAFDAAQDTLYELLPPPAGAPASACDHSGDAPAWSGTSPAGQAALTRRGSGPTSHLCFQPAAPYWAGRPWVVALLAGVLSTSSPSGFLDSGEPSGAARPSAGRRRPSGGTRSPSSRRWPRQTPRWSGTRRRTPGAGDAPRCRCCWRGTPRGSGPPGRSGTGPTW